MGGKTILIADDDRSLVRALCLRCKLLGLSTLTAYDARSAEKTIREKRPDLACLDGVMPPGNGLTTCQNLVEEDLYPLKLILLTSQADRKTIDYCRKAGIHYVRKTNDIWSVVQPLLQSLLNSESTNPSTNIS